MTNLVKEHTPNRSLLMDYICSDVIIDKMAMFIVGTLYVITKMSFVCGSHNMELLDKVRGQLV